MNEYIISPMWFYWANVVNTLTIFLIIGSIAGAVITAIIYCSAYESYDEKERKWWLKRAKISLTITIMTLLATIFTPTKDTLIKMKLAEFGTYDNVATVIETIEDMADKIIESGK